jgi:protein-disulfide isomerase
MTDTNEPAGSFKGKAGGARTALIAAAAAGVLLGGGGMALWAGGGGGDGDREEMANVVRETLLEHPEILQEASQRLQQREFGKVVEANRAAFETPFGGAWAGAEDGDVVLVEFFDYACGYCRKSNADVERLLVEDSKLKVVWREWPVLGPDSERAAEASLAAAKQGRFHDYFKRVFAAGRPTEAAIAQARQASGVTQAVAADEVKNELARNFQLAQAVSASGTPTFVVGDQVLHGAVGYDALKAAIADARKRG